MQYVIPIPEQVRDDSREYPFLYIILLFIIKFLQGHVVILLLCIAFANTFTSFLPHAFCSPANRNVIMFPKIRRDS